MHGREAVSQSVAVRAAPSMPARQGARALDLSLDRMRATLRTTSPTRPPNGELMSVRPSGRLRRALRRTPFGARLAAAARPQRLRRAVLDSGLFDEEWYRAHAGAALGESDAVRDYLGRGWLLGLSPTPAFAPAWYRQAARIGPQVDSFLHYLQQGAAKHLAPHPCFDSAWYAGRHRGAERHPGGALGHYLSQGWAAGAEPHPTFDSGAYRGQHPEVEGAPFLHFARATAALGQRTRGHADFVRNRPQFDHAAAAAFVAAMREANERDDLGHPLVTVVIPTKDRAVGVADAVRSVLAQTYPHWQLVVVDDGGVDDTEAALEPMLSDERVEYVRRDASGGVSTARNTGLARARGDYVAYLDSDNTWIPEFLEVMVAFVLSTGARFAYAGSELREAKRGGRVLYRASPFDRGALEERNFIDCIVVLHERALIDEVGPFDESLRRNVDWELFLRMADHTDLALAPFIATSYDPWEDRDDRISIQEPPGYRFMVKSKRFIDWDRAQGAVDGRTPGLLSVVIHTHGPVPDTAATVARVTAGRPDVEVVLVDAGRGPGDFEQLQLLAATHPAVRTVRLSEEVSTELALNIGAVESQGEHLLFLPDGCLPQGTWREALFAAAHDGAVVQPLFVDRGGVVMSAGLAVSRNGAAHHLFRGFSDQSPEVAAPAERSVISGYAFMRARDFVAVRGFDPIFVNDVENGDLSLRLALDRGLPLRNESSAVVVWVTAQGAGRSITTLFDNRLLISARLRDAIASDDIEVWAAAGYRIVGYEVEKRAAAGRHGALFEPVVVADRPERPQRWAIKIAAPTVERREGWGDWHFALSLKAALERVGREVVVDCKEAWYRPTAHLDDVVVTLRGVSRYIPNPRHANLLWIISHPERVTPREVGSFDRSFAASTSYSARFSLQHGLTVHPLLQCTDRDRFRPVVPDPDRAHEVLFVGNARGLRSSVAAALDAGFEPAVYGVRWKGLLPRRSLKATYVPNAELPHVYCAAGAVLNDHWDEMRDQGFLSNRVFDVAACAAPLVTDPVSGLEETFSDAVETFASADEMGAALRRQLEDTPARRAARHRLSSVIREQHSFDARAQTLVAAATELLDVFGLRSPRGPG